ncbi:uncharacterized protein CTRU02_204939 [Colletotrichum truncatum]|uniref:Uncharacterized protein n=1 Tax=Colletotrichum truncatum TaxID=5467 RepID=A0ACC3Z2L2_COLTU|nr:uncharacterized protein CTRU02_14001 [Colletotrichum truncatum]KAF6782682.1 hypothetical protein CTRU02_14001 [Colletotrichum truncatum]
MLQSKFPSSLTSLFLVKVVLAIVFILIAFHSLYVYSELRTATRINHISSPALRAPRGGRCLPQYSPSLLKKLESLKSSCQPPPAQTSQWRVTTVTAHFGKLEKHYQNALQTHVLHTMLHRTKLEVMCAPVIDDLWNKPAFILSLLLDEMLKRPEDRTDWIFWVDRDTLILDECRPASSFLPPYTVDADGEASKQIKDNDVQLLVTDDWNGLNNGVFLLRVGRWAVELFSAIVAFRHYRPDVKLPFTEQSAMEILIKEPKFKDAVQFVPQHWFNTYPGGNATRFLERNDEEGLADYQARRGDFLVHFAGVPAKDKSIDDWVDILGGMPDVWDAEKVQRNTTTDVEAFWAKINPPDTLPL